MEKNENALYQRALRLLEKAKDAYELNPNPSNLYWVELWERECIRLGRSKSNLPKKNRTSLRRFDKPSREEIKVSLEFLAPKKSK